MFYIPNNYRNPIPLYPLPPSVTLSDEKNVISFPAGVGKRADV